ncbi:uncharacterized protein LOC126792512 [Argentina anserina]|uniref:uncharacterized protein LOC126792512 n=1 Tax=Argentina anserina TaxID=57926 RepID=UPI00217644DA|nr:uncharacterized protein LOC126792512 [Potentilla anserina]
MGVGDDADFLRIREILKERIRKERRTASDFVDDCSVDKKKIPKHRPFFGPSQHCISQRLIEGRDALMQELRISSQDVSKVEILDTITDPESSELEAEPGTANVAKLRESRDYSWLSTDEEVPKEDDGINKDIFVSKSSDAQTPNSKQPLKTLSGWQKPSSAKNAQDQSNTPKKEKSMADRPQCSLKSKPSLEKSKYENKERLKTIAEKVDDEDSDKDEDEDNNVYVSSIIQGLFRGNRKRPATLDYDDRDDRAMVSSFADIEREERRSAKLARQEDEIEALRIEQEEKERLRRAKKRKLLQKSTTE